MSLALLDSLQSESTRLALAGSRFAREDFRLRKIIEPLQELGTKSPVFAKLAESTNALLDASEDDSSAKLLALLTMVRAVRSAQASAGVEGDLVPVAEPRGTRDATPMSARRLLSIVDCLVNSGDGRLSRLEGEIERGIEPDARIFHHVCKAVETGHAQLSDMLIQKMLPSMGKEAFDVFAASYSMDGKSTDIRRLRAMAVSSRTDALPYLLLAASKAKVDMRIAAITLLGHPKAGETEISFLKEITEDKNAKISSAATSALASTGKPSIFGFLQQMFDRNPEDKRRNLWSMIFYLPPGENSFAFALEELTHHTQLDNNSQSLIGYQLAQIAKGCPRLPNIGSLFPLLTESQFLSIVRIWRDVHAVSADSVPNESVKPLVDRALVLLEQWKNGAPEKYLCEYLGHLEKFALLEKEGRPGDIMKLMHELWAVMPLLIRADVAKWGARFPNIAPLVSHGDGGKELAELFAEILQIPASSDEKMQSIRWQAVNILRQLFLKDRMGQHIVYDILAPVLLKVAQMDSGHLAMGELVQKIRSHGYTDANLYPSTLVKEEKEQLNSLLESLTKSSTPVSELERYCYESEIFVVLVDERWISLLPQLHDSQQPVWTGVPLVHDLFQQKLAKIASQNQSHE